MLEDVDELLRASGVEPARARRARRRHRARAASPACASALATARGLALALELPVAGVSTLDALAAGAPGALPVIDARRREVFTLRRRRSGGVRPGGAALEPGTSASATAPCATASVLEARGAEVPPDDDERHLPRARFHAQLARDFGPAEAVEPLYLRVPDAEQAAA